MLKKKKKKKRRTYRYYKILQFHFTGKLFAEQRDDENYKQKISCKLLLQVHFHHLNIVAVVLESFSINKKMQFYPSFLMLKFKNFTNFCC